MPLVASRDRADERAPPLRCANITRMNDSTPTFLDIRLWDRSALVLMDWLLATNEQALPFAHPAQKQALRDLLAALEWCRGLGYTDEELAEAQEQVARDMSSEDRSL